MVAGTLGNRGLRSHTELDGHVAYIPVAFSQNQREEVREVEVPGALAAEPGTHQQTYIAQPVPYDLFQITAPVNRQNRKPGDPCHTLARDNAAHAAVAFTPGNLARGAGPSPNAEVAPTMKCSAGRGTDDQRTCVAMVGTDLYNGAITGDVAATMGTPGSSVNASGPTLMAFPIDGRNAMRDPEKLDEMNRQGIGIGDTGDPSHTLTSACVHAVAKAMTVRRLTAKECERLQAFPDDYTLIPWRKKPADECPDGPRYKALGNSMACNCMAWIGERIAAVEARND